MYSATNTIWVLLGAALVFFMQAGFAMVETGFTRAKNAGNIIMKNLMDFSIGTPIFWIVGFGLMFGSGNGFIGNFDLFSLGDYSGILPDGVPFFAYFIFQTVFCATAATIVSGAMAERTKFISYCIYSAAISLIIYPISGHWIWGGGWLAQLGFHDFAGSTAVHMVGGVAALVGAIILGPRIGKYDEKGNSKAIPGHSLTLGALGVFILWFCWFGFNGGSTVGIDSDSLMESAGHIFVTTNLAAAVATLTTMIFTWIKYKKPDVSMTLNGSLAGLVAITAGCDVVDPFGAAIIGMVAGIAVVVAIEFVDKKLKIDDPVGAVGVHGVNGLLGTLLTGLFSTNSEIGLGLFYGGGFKFFTTQLIGIIAVIAWVAITMTIVFQIIKHTIGLRASEQEETEGLDITEHGLMSSYADFMPTQATLSLSALGSKSNVDTINATVVPPDSSIADVTATIQPNLKTPDIHPTKMSKITIMINQNKLEILKAALDNIGITGITVTQALGCGMQKGHKEYYRGVEFDTHLLPKVKVEIVVCKVPVDVVINTVKKVLGTGNIGDGKIFVYDVVNAIKIRTGEEGYEALQDE